MSFADWSGGPSGSWETLSTASPIEGVSSLRWNLSNFQAGIFRGRTLGADLTTGRRITRFKVATNLPSGGGANRWGVCGMMQSSIDIGSNAYWAYIASGALTTLNIGKGILGGTVGTTLFNVASGTIPSIATGTIYAVGLQWQRDAGSGQMVLTAQFGTAADFSDLTTIATYTDSSSPYSTAVTSGIGAHSSGAGSAFDIYWDQTRLYRA